VGVVVCRDENSLQWSKRKVEQLSPEYVQAEVHSIKAIKTTCWRNEVEVMDGGEDAVMTAIDDVTSISPQLYLLVQRTRPPLFLSTSADPASGGRYKTYIVTGTETPTTRLTVLHPGDSPVSCLRGYYTKSLLTFSIFYDPRRKLIKDVVKTYIVTLTYFVKVKGQQKVKLGITLSRQRQTVGKRSNVTTKVKVTYLLSTRRHAKKSNISMKESRHKT